MPPKLSAARVAEGLSSLKGWTYQEPPAIAKTFRFKDHIAAMGFVTKVAMAAEVMDHHPDLRIVYNRVEITLNTHSARGVTKLDLELAAKIDALK